MKRRGLFLGTMAGAMVLGMSAAAAEPELNRAGETYEYGHFTAEAIVVDANSEDFNENADFTVYSINDYTEAVPMADGYDANGVTSGNNTASMYLIMDHASALLIDLGNGAASTASHFGEDAEEQEILDSINQEYRELIYGLIGDRELSIAITHNHGDHLGYLSAMAGDNIKLYFPEADYTDSVVENYGDLSETYDLETFVPGEFTISLGDDLELSTIDCAGHSNGSTIFVLETPVVTYEYDDAGEAVGSSGQYLVFSGDAIGSGASVYIFSVDAMNTFAQSIGPVYATLATYTTYNDYLSDEAKEDATILIEGGHGWQTTSRLGEMTMGLAYVENMRDLVDQIKNGNWVEEGTDDMTLEELLQEGNLVTKAIDQEMPNVTIYYGTDLSSVAAITTSTEILDEYAGISADNAQEEVVTEAVE